MSKQGPIKGFRPGKEPPQLKKRRAKQQFGELSGTQERLVELFAERSVEESEALINRWVTGLLVTWVILVVVAGVLTLWSVLAAVVVGVLGVIALGIWWRLRGQREGLLRMAEQTAGRR